MSNAVNTPKVRQYGNKCDRNRNPKGVSTETITLDVVRISLNQVILGSNVSLKSLERQDPITAFFPLSGDPASVPSLEVDFTIEEPVEIFTNGVDELHTPKAVAGASTIEL
ncbi:hypothetical protein H0H93_008183, partial [Arthromyces matolae]